MTDAICDHLGAQRIPLTNDSPRNKQEEASEVGQTSVATLRVIALPGRDDRLTPERVTRPGPLNDDGFRSELIPLVGIKVT